MNSTATKVPLGWVRGGPVSLRCGYLTLHLFAFRRTSGHIHSDVHGLGLRGRDWLGHDRGGRRRRCLGTGADDIFHLATTLEFHTPVRTHHAERQKRTDARYVLVGWARNARIKTAALLLGTAAAVGFDDCGRALEQLTYFLRGLCL